MLAVHSDRCVNRAETSFRLGIRPGPAWWLPNCSSSPRRRGGCCYHVLLSWGRRQLSHGRNHSNTSAGTAATAVEATRILIRAAWCDDTTTGRAPEDPSAPSRPPERCCRTDSCCRGPMTWGTGTNRLGRSESCRWSERWSGRRRCAATLYPADRPSLPLRDYYDVRREFEQSARASRCRVVASILSQRSSRKTMNSSAVFISRIQAVEDQDFACLISWAANPAH